MFGMLGTIFGWLFDWKVLAVVGVVAAVVAYRLLGRTGALAALAATAGLVLFRKGQQSGAASARAKQERIDKRAVERRQEVQKDVARAPKEEVRKRLERWAKD